MMRASIQNPVWLCNWNESTASNVRQAHLIISSYSDRTAVHITSRSSPLTFLLMHLFSFFLPGRLCRIHYAIDEADAENLHHHRLPQDPPETTAAALGATETPHLAWVSLQLFVQTWFCLLVSCSSARRQFGLGHSRIPCSRNSYRLALLDAVIGFRHEDRVTW